MRKLFVIFALILAANSAFADIGRSTTFDDREVCEKTKGSWRQFGNSLGDNCEAKFDQFSIAAQVTTYSCDCGKGRCWNGERCVLMQDYKKFYEARQEAEKKKIEEAKRARHKEYQDTSSAIIQAMVGGNKGAASSTDNSGAANNNTANFYGKLIPNSPTRSISDVATPVLDSANKQAQQLIDQGGDAVKQVQQGPLGKIFSVPKKETPAATDSVAAPAVPAAPVDVGGPTPFFLQQQEKAQKAAEEVAKAMSSANKDESSKIVDSSKTIIMDAPGLPQIPLPQ